MAPPETSWSFLTLLPRSCPTSNPPANHITSSSQALPEPNTSQHLSGQGPVISQRDRGERHSAGPWLPLLPRRALSQQKSDHIVSLRNTKGLSPHTQDRTQRPHRDPQGSLGPQLPPHPQSTLFHPQWPAPCSPNRQAFASMFPRAGIPAPRVPLHGEAVPYHTV